MSYSNQSIDATQAGQPKKSGWTIFWLILVVVAFIGQTAAVYIPAFVGISPSDGDPTQAPSRLLGALLWPSLVGVFLQKLKGRRKLAGALIGLVVGAVLYTGAFVVAGQKSAGGSSSGSNPALSSPDNASHTSAWVQSELTEDYMRQISKDDCMVKTIEVLKNCETQDCFMTMAGVSGDCVTWAKGDFDNFCSNYQQRYLEPNCEVRQMSEMACVVLDTGKKVYCEGYQ